MNYEVTLGIDDPDEFADLMILLATNQLLGSIQRIGYGVMEQVKPEKPVRAHRRGAQEVKGFVRGGSVGNEFPTTKDLVRPKRTRPPTDYREVLRKASERGTSGLSRIQAILKYMVQHGGKITIDEVGPCLLDEGLSMNRNPMTPVVTRHLARSVRRGEFEITPDGVAYIMQVMEKLKAA